MQGLLGMTIQGEFSSRFCVYNFFSTLFLAFYLLLILCNILLYLKNKTGLVFGILGFGS